METARKTVIMERPENWTTSGNDSGGDLAGFDILF
jgi:hypothetical protein